MVREYPVKKGVKLSTEMILEKTKGITDDAEIRDDHIIASIPGMKVIDLYTNGKSLFAQTEADGQHKDFASTIKTYNQLIENITGFSSKERKKKFSKTK